MLKFSGKNLNFIKFLLGSLGIFRILQFFIHGQVFLLPDGPLPSSFVYEMSSPVFLKYIPFYIIQWFPYWCGMVSTVLVIHLGLLALFLLNVSPRIFLPLLIVFEYGLYTRTSFLAHAGDSLFLFTLILFFIHEWIPLRLKWVTPLLWVSQGLLLYFFSGVYKDFNLWFVQGSALQDFSDYYSHLTNRHLIQWDSLGVLLSRATLIIEIGVSLVLILCFLGFFKIRSFVLYVLFSTFALIHLGSSFFFSLYTLPWILLSYLLGTALQFKQAKEIALKPKLTFFSIILFLHLFPYLGLNLFPFDLFPLRQQWSLFANAPPAKMGSITATLNFEHAPAKIFKFNETFQWQRYQEYLIEEYSESERFRKNFKRFACEAPGASLLILKTSYSEYQFSCKNK